jgi:phosphate starvation-inducible protein PhoH
MPANTNEQKRLTRKERRLQRQNQEVIKEKLNFTLKKINPLTENQRRTFNAYDNDKHLLLIGTAGTGKSFLSIYLGMQDIMEQRTHEKMIIIRSVVPTRDMGFLPGSNKEKSKVYEAPYYAIFSELFGRGDAYDYLKNKNLVEFMTTSFVRGITLSDCVIIVDEIQNMNAQEVNSIFTRIGKNCRVMFAGDIKQNDLSNKKHDVSGFRDFIKVIHQMKSFAMVDFQAEDVVRGDLVREYILTRERLEQSGVIEPLS